MDMVSQRAFTLRTLTGHTIRFVPGKPSFVPPPAQEAAMQAGCVFVDKSHKAPNQETEDEDETGMKASLREPQGDARMAKVREAVEALIARNKSTDFAASGRPLVEKLSKLAGFEVTAKERDTVLDKMRDERTE